MGFIVIARDIDLLQSLQFLHRNLRDEQGVVAQLRLASHPAVLAGAENVIGIGEDGSDADGAGLCVHLPIDKLDVAFQGVDLAVGERQREGNGGFTFEQVAARATSPLDEGQIFCVADGKVDFDGVELGDGGQHRLGVDQIADLRGGLAGDAGNQRPHMGEAKVQLSVFDRSFSGGYRSLCGLHRGLGLRLLLNIVVELALGDGTGLGERSIPLDVDLGQTELRLRLKHLTLCLGQLAFGLIERCLERTRIDLEQDLAFGHLGAFSIILFDQIAVSLGLDLRVDVAVERADPLIGNGHVGWLELNDRDRQRLAAPLARRNFFHSR